MKKRTILSKSANRQAKKSSKDLPVVAEKLIIGPMMYIIVGQTHLSDLFDKLNQLC